jgi:aerobic carbon-monoxide dehydrogenase medium subunit
VSVAADPGWLVPSSLEEALELRAARGDEATVLAGGTFLGILMNQGFVSPSAFLSLGRVGELSYVRLHDGELRLGAMASHRQVERSESVRRGWPVLARAFALVASPRVRNQATVGGVLADADYASDPPAALTALGARVVLRSPHAARFVPVDELILGYYETCIAPDELLVEVRVPPAPGRGVYRKFRSRSSEDRPCVAVAAVNDGEELRIVVGAVTETPQHYPDVCELATGRRANRELAAEIGRRYAERIEPLADSRGSAAYRRRVTAVEVRRAVEDLTTEGAS